MVIVETTVFIRRMVELRTDDEYRKLQVVLSNRPSAGAIIRQSGGLRKIRWSLEGKGKSGGIRIIYYWAVQHERLLMLFAYPKTVQADLTAKQVNILRKLIEAEYP